MRADNRIPAALLPHIFTYNPDTGDLIWKHRPDVAKQINSRCAGRVAGTKKPGEIQVCIQHDGVQRLYRAHHIVWALVTGAWPEQDIDHEDCDPWNNRWLDLREATPSQNRCNIRRVRGVSGFRGVFPRKRGEKPFWAKIRARGEQIVIGHFWTAEAAARAYDNAAIKLHGQFAVTNEMLGLLEAQV